MYKKSFYTQALFLAIPLFLIAVFSGVLTSPMAAENRIDRVEYQYLNTGQINFYSNTGRAFILDSSDNINYSLNANGEYFIKIHNNDYLITVEIFNELKKNGLKLSKVGGANGGNPNPVPMPNPPKNPGPSPTDFLSANNSEVASGASFKVIKHYKNEQAGGGSASFVGPTKDGKNCIFISADHVISNESDDDIFNLRPRLDYIEIDLNRNDKIDPGERIDFDADQAKSSGERSIYTDNDLDKNGDLGLIKFPCSLIPKDTPYFQILKLKDLQNIFGIKDGGDQCYAIGYPKGDFKNFPCNISRFEERDFIYSDNGGDLGGLSGGAFSTKSGTLIGVCVRASPSVLISSFIGNFYSVIKEAGDSFVPKQVANDITELNKPCISMSALYGKLSTLHKFLCTKPPRSPSCDEIEPIIKFMEDNKEKNRLTLENGFETKCLSSDFKEMTGDEQKSLCNAKRRMCYSEERYINYENDDDKTEEENKKMKNIFYQGYLRDKPVCDEVRELVKKVNLSCPE